MPPRKKPSWPARPPGPGTSVNVRLQPPLLKQLDDWRRMQDDLPNRSEAVRRLLGAALERQTK